MRLYRIFPFDLGDDGFAWEMLGNEDWIGRRMVCDRFRDADEDEGRLYGNAVVNCQFTYQDGNAFEGRSTGLMIDNVLLCLEIDKVLFGDVQRLTLYCLMS